MKNRVPSSKVEGRKSLDLLRPGRSGHFFLGDGRPALSYSIWPCGWKATSSRWNLSPVSAPSRDSVHREVQHGRESTDGRHRAAAPVIGSSIPEVVKTATLPVQNILRMMPLGAAVFDPDHLMKWEEKVAEHERQHELEHATKVKERDELTLRTNR
jgi:hypothetical protein